MQYQQEIVDGYFFGMPPQRIYVSLEGFATDKQTSRI